MRPSHCIATIIVAAAMPWQTAALAQTVTNYQCRDGAQLAVAFYPKDKSAHVQIDGKTVRLLKRVAVVGTRYARNDITLRIMKTTTTLQRGQRMTECTAK